MSLSNQDAVTRLTELHSTLNVISQDADNQARLWADVNQQTVQAIDAALQAQGVATVEDLTQKIIAEIGDAEKRADVVQLLADLTPATTFGGMLWDKIKDPVEDVMTIANFIAVGQFANKAWVMNAESWNLRMAQTRAMGAFTTASRARLAANFTNGAIRGVNQGLTAEEIAEIERQTNLDVIDEAAEGEEEDFNEIIDTTAQGVEDAKVAYAAARTDCIYVLAFVALFSIAEWAYNKCNEEQIADELRSAIQQLCTARLYATRDQDTAGTYASLGVQQQFIVSAMTASPPQPVDSSIASYVTAAKELQGFTTDSDYLQTVYNDLLQQDQQDPMAMNNLAYDPDFATMEQMHQKQMDKINAKVQQQVQASQQTAQQGTPTQPTTQPTTQSN